MPETIKKQLTMTPLHAKKLIGRIFGVPVLIQSAAIDAMMSAVQASIGSLISGECMQSGAESRLSSSAGVTVIPVKGVLLNEYDWVMDCIYGVTCYDDIRRQFRQALADPDITAIVFEINSPGGEVCGCFDLVDDIYAARGAKPIFALINEDAYSAAYAIASAADQIYLPRTGGVGSIGVIAMHIDQSKWDEMTGLSFTAIFAGDRKNDFTPHEPLSDTARAILQQSVNDTYDLFIKTVARNRGMKASDVRATQAAMYEGSKAVEAGLADQVVTREKAMSAILKNSKQKGGANMKFWQRMIAFFKNLDSRGIVDAKELAGELKTVMAEVPVEDVQAVFAELGYILKPSEGSMIMSAADMDKMKQDADKAGSESMRNSILQILDCCAVAGMEKAAAQYVRDGLSLEDVQKNIVGAKADEVEKTRIRSTVGAVTTGAVNPLIEDAKKRAAEANIRIVKK